MTEIFVDNFAGGGGASCGYRMATGRDPEIAINHDQAAVAMHAANHPATEHFCEDVWSIDPVAVTRGCPVGAAWFSPDCKHHSKAKGGKPRDKKIRGLAWIVIKWARLVRPRVIFLENVEEFADWGPLTAEGRPCPLRKAKVFNSWKRQLEAEGFVVEWKLLRACEFGGAPTIRRRLYLIARRDGLPIIWPAATHGAPGSPGVLSGALRPWPVAADCIDWSIPCHSIFLTKAEARIVRVKRPLVEASLRRIARGLWKFVINAKDPFIVPSGYGGERISSVPIVANTANSKTSGRAPTTGQEAREPLHTVTGQGGHFAEVRAFLVKYYGLGGQDQALDDPMHTIPTKDRLGLVTVHGIDYAIADICIRMLTPRELFRAQGFPEDYVIDVRFWKKLRKKSLLRWLSNAEKVRMCGNSVCPPTAALLIGANVPEMAVNTELAA